MADTLSTIAVERAPNRPLPTLCDRVLEDFLTRRWQTQDAPPQLRPTMERFARTQLLDNEAALDQALLELMVAAAATLARLRHACPELIHREGG